MRTIDDPLIVDLFLYSYEAGFIQKLVKDKKIQKLTPLISFSDILMIFCHNPNFAKWSPPKELEIKETTETASSALFLDIQLKFDKRDGFNFAIINCAHLDSNIPTAPTYISQLVRYVRACYVRACNLYLDLFSYNVAVF